MKKFLKIILIVIPILALLATAVFVLLRYPSREKNIRYGELVTEGNSHLENNEYAKAIKSYDEAATLVSNRFEAYDGIAKVLSKKNQFAQLRDMIDKSASTLSSSEKALLLNNLGEGYLKVGNFQSAKNSFQEALALDSGNELSKLGYVESLLGTGVTNEIDKYLDIPKESVNFTRQYLLKLLAKRTDVVGIKEILTQEIVTENPQEKAMIDDYKKIASIDVKEDIYIAALVSKVYVNNGYNKLAINILEPIKDKIMEYQDGVYILSVAYFNDEQYEKTNSLLKEFSNPNSNPNISILEAKVYSMLEDETMAIKSFNNAVKFASEKTLDDVYKEYLDYLFEKDLLNNAKDILDKTAKITKDSWVDIAYLKLYYSQKVPDKAYFYVTKLEKNTKLTDSEKKEYLYYGINQDIESQKYEDAALKLVKYKELDDKSPNYYLLLGKLMIQTADVPNAKTNLEKAIEYDLTGEVTESAKKLLSRIN